MVKKFEDCIETIDKILEAKRRKWHLRAIAFMDYDDVSQIIRLHIYNKWHLYDQTKSLEPWIARVVDNQIRNLIKNKYSSYSRPCLKCAANQGDDLCSLYEKQCQDCPLFKIWSITRKRAHDTKLPVSIENCPDEVHNVPSDGFDLVSRSKELHEKMQKILKENEWVIYYNLYILGKSEEEVAREAGYTTSEKGRPIGYKRLRQYKKLIFEKAKKIVYGD
jgi:DNA-directed RNA polymerase specialized sigma subunit